MADYLWRTPGMKDTNWKMPKWMEPYRGSICNTGGNSVEELYNDNHTDALTNFVRAALCVAVKSQVILLERLHEEGMLR